MTRTLRGIMAVALVMGLSTIFTGNAHAQVSTDSTSAAGIERINDNNDNYDRDYNREARRGYNYGHRGSDRNYENRGYMHERRGNMHDRGERRGYMHDRSNMQNDDRGSYRDGRHNRGGGWGGNHHRGR